MTYIPSIQYLGFLRRPVYTVGDSQTGFGMHQGRKILMTEPARCPWRKILIPVSPTVLNRSTLPAVTKPRPSAI